MAKEPSIECTGIVVDCLPNEEFSVRLDGSDHIIRAYISGNIRKNQIRILTGDKVKIEMTPYDTTRGRIRFRG